MLELTCPVYGQQGSSRRKYNTFSRLKCCGAIRYLPDYSLHFNISIISFSDSGEHSMVGLLLGEEVGLMPAVSAPPIGERKAVTLETAQYNMNQIKEGERARGEAEASHHEEDISEIAGIVPPTGERKTHILYGHILLTATSSLSHPQVRVREGDEVCVDALHS